MANFSFPVDTSQSWERETDDSVKEKKKKKQPRQTIYSLLAYLCLHFKGLIGQPLVLSYTLSSILRLTCGFCSAEQLITKCLASMNCNLRVII